MIGEQGGVENKTAVNGDMMEGRDGVHDYLKTWTVVVQTCGTSAEMQGMLRSIKEMQEGHSPCPAPKA